MDYAASSEDRVLLLKIQNSQKPDQITYLVWDRQVNAFVTDGVRDLYRLKEIRIDAPDVLQDLEEYAYVLSYLLETMSTAAELNLPYGYQNQFEVRGRTYSLAEEGEYRVLRPLAGPGVQL